jgi:Acyl-CoA dehydrogenase, C-terminal domain
MNLSVLSDPGAADNPVKSDRPAVAEIQTAGGDHDLDDLPKNAVGKIAKPALRQWLASTHLPGHPTPPLNPPPNTHIGELRWLYHTGFPGRGSGGIPRQADVDGLNSERIVVGLADSWIRLESARLMAMHAAELYDHHQNCGLQAAAAKYLGAEAGFDACDRAMSTHGGYAYAKEYHVERLWREARLLRNAPFSQEMVLNYISTQALKLPRAY